MSKHVAFPLIGGAHQVYHTAPVAAALSAANPDIRVSVLASEKAALALAKRAAEFYPGASLHFDLLKSPIIGRVISRVKGGRSVLKILLLWRNRRRLATFDAIVVPECTSTYLRRMGVKSPRLMCVPHGAGDRAISFEPRFQQFDRVLVAGEKTAERMTASGVSAERVSVVGYPKADLIRRMTAHPAALFGNAKPVVLYNPHFRRSLSSLDHAKSIVEAFARQDRFNLIFAPHIRAFRDASSSEIAAWERMAQPGKLIVDLGSENLINMTYTMAADVYLGDVSSQVYEFLLSPRPCVFINAHAEQWETNPDYDFWRLGEVVAPHGVVDAVERAFGVHETFLLKQEEAISRTFGAETNASLRAAQAIGQDVRANCGCRNELVR